MLVDTPTLVLGGGRSVAIVDEAGLARRGVELVRRRSGGGAVLLVPGHHEWIDVWVPRGTPERHDDVGRGADRLGGVLGGALDRTRRGPASIAPAPHPPTRWSSSVCFAGVGSGEVLIGGRKAVGVSQRRTRDWIRLQSLVHRRWDAATTFGLLRDAEAAAASEWADRVVGIGDVDAVGAFAHALSDA
ncbi:MAG: hypothetical protein R2695_15975 [Acidimicrobiales bacterium]